MYVFSIIVYLNIYSLFVMVNACGKSNKNINTMGNRIKESLSKDRYLYLGKMIIFSSIIYVYISLMTWYLTSVIGTVYPQVSPSLTVF